MLDLVNFTIIVGFVCYVFYLVYLFVIETTLHRFYNCYKYFTENVFCAICIPLELWNI